MQPRSDSGFTLTEILVAMFLFSLLSVTSLQVVSTAIRSKEAMDSRMSDIETLQITRSLLRADIAAITPDAVRDNAGRLDFVVFQGGRSLGKDLIFTRSGQLNPSGMQKRGDLLRVEYIFDDGTLYRESQSVNQTGLPNAEPSRRALMSGISSVRWQFTAPTGSLVDSYESRAGLQQPEWQISDPLPDAVWLTLNLDDGTSIRQGFEVGR